MKTQRADGAARIGAQQDRQSLGVRYDEKNCPRKAMRQWGRGSSPLMLVASGITKTGGGVRRVVTVGNQQRVVQNSDPPCDTGHAIDASKPIVYYYGLMEK